MPRARRHVREDEIELGFFKFLLTGVKYAHDGIENLLYNVPFGQNEWAKFDDAGTSTKSEVEDSATSRILTRVNADAAGTHRIQKRIHLSLEFGLFPDVALAIITRRTGALTTLKFSLFKGGSADSAVDGVDVSPVVINTFEAFEFTPADVYVAGEFVTLELEYVSSTIDVAVDIGDIEFMFKSGLGNV